MIIEKIIRAHKFLCEYYHHILIETPQGQKALNYLLDRGMTLETIKKFKIGYAINSKDYFTKVMTQKGYTLDELDLGGLIYEHRDGHFIDRWRDRIMFPICNSDGQVIAFSGRHIGNSNCKYLNSPETPLFYKSEVLFNLHNAKHSIMRTRRVFLFEGFMDTIAADGAEVNNSVAVMGTALTQEALFLLEGMVDEFVICFDSDGPGVEATNRTIDLILGNNPAFKISIHNVRDAKDPDEFIHKFGKEKFQESLKFEKMSVIDFKKVYYKKGRQTLEPSEIIEYISNILSEIKKLNTPEERNDQINQLAKEFNISIETLKSFR